MEEEQQVLIPASELRVGDIVIRSGNRPMRVDFISREPARRRWLWRPPMPELVTIHSDPKQRDAAELGFIAMSSQTLTYLTFTADSLVRVERTRESS